MWNTVGPIYCPTSTALLNRMPSCSNRFTGVRCQSMPSLEVAWHTQFTFLVPPSVMNRDEYHIWNRPWSSS